MSERNCIRSEAVADDLDECAVQVGTVSGNLGRGMPGGDSAKVRTGQVGAHRQALPGDVAAALDARWTEVVAPALGFADYAALEAASTRDAAESPGGRGHSEARIA